MIFLLNFKMANKVNKSHNFFCQKWQLNVSEFEGRPTAAYSEWVEKYKARSLWNGFRYISEPIKKHEHKHYPITVIKDE